MRPRGRESVSLSTLGPLTCVSLIRESVCLYVLFLKMIVSSSKMRTEHRIVEVVYSGLAKVGVGAFSLLSVKRTRCL